MLDNFYLLLATIHRHSASIASPRLNSEQSSRWSAVALSSTSHNRGTLVQSVQSRRLWFPIINFATKFAAGFWKSFPVSSPLLVRDFQLMAGHRKILIESNGTPPFLTPAAKDIAELLSRFAVHYLISAYQNWRWCFAGCCLTTLTCAKLFAKCTVRRSSLARFLSCLVAALCYTSANSYNIFPASFCSALGKEQQENVSRYNRRRE